MGFRARQYLSHASHHPLCHLRWEVRPAVSGWHNEKVVGKPGDLVGKSEKESWLKAACPVS